MKTRIGKIARLPKLIRDELNHRLDDGADGPELLTWLNALPEVQRVLAEKFGGRPLTKHNLFDWRHGGYAEWAADRNGRLQWQDLIERGCELDQKRTGSKGTDVTGHLGTFLIIELHEAINQLHKVKDPNQRWKVLQMISRVLARLQNEHSRNKRIRLWETKAERRNQQIAPSCPQLPSKKKFNRAPNPSPPNPGRAALPPRRPIFPLAAPAANEPHELEIPPRV